MSITSVTENLVTGHNKALGKELGVPETQHSETAKTSELSHLTDGASLSSLAPRIQAVLNEIASPDDNVLDALASNVSSLQDGFIDTLYNSLADQGVDLANKLTLRLGKSGQLSLAGDHPDKETVEKLLHDKPELSTAFREIASQSELLRDIRNISKVMYRQSGPENYARMADDAGAATYQMSLKGDMSHFYFSRVQ